MDTCANHCVRLDPVFNGQRSVKSTFLRRVEELSSIEERDQVARFRSDALQKTKDSGFESRSLRACISVLCDLKVQGWSFRVCDSTAWGYPPKSEAMSAQLEKQRVREAHLFERDSQLRNPATREFVRNMERRRLGPSGWVSIHSLMRDGQELSSGIRSALLREKGPISPEALRTCVDPYIQVVDPDSKCEFTGLRLFDIWRYFRHTWVIPYYSVPGRQICVLVRDRAAANHPVIGIGAFGSAVVQLTPRDKWIGWTPETFVEQLKARPSDRWAKWLHKSQLDLVRGIYIKDFIKEKIITRPDLRFPSFKVIERLLKEAKEARHWHTRFPKASQHKKVSQHWEDEARSYLFRAKRARTLAELLKARMRLIEAGFSSPNKESLKRTLASSGGRRAIRAILNRVKGRHVGIGMLDIIVCGAIPPYNPILGGKLVALLLTSPEVTLAYEKRYASTPSIIASSMAGRPVVRKPSLVLLGTTSLYGVSSSQYNRLKFPAELAGGIPGRTISYEMIGRSVGYGSYHLSATTVNEIEVLLAQSDEGRKVNSIFGEGVNPRLRKIRDGLDLLGFPSDAILRHGNPRLVYGVPLAANFREVLLGVSDRPKYILPRNAPTAVTNAIADFWLSRWLAKRVEREEVLEEAAKHSLVYPLSHGAKVVLPPVDSEEQTLVAAH